MNEHFLNLAIKMIAGVLDGHLTIKTESSPESIEMLAKSQLREQFRNAHKTRVLSIFEELLLDIDIIKAKSQSEKMPGADRYSVEHTRAMKLLAMEHNFLLLREAIVELTGSEYVPAPISELWDIITNEFYIMGGNAKESTKEKESPDIKTGSELITEMRREQIQKHKFTPHHDASHHAKNELLKAALFAMSHVDGQWPESWGTEFKEKIEKKTKIERLAVAGAFIAAEIDRLLLLGDSPENEHLANTGFESSRVETYIIESMAGETPVYHISKKVDKTHIHLGSNVFYSDAVISVLNMNIGNKLVKFQGMGKDRTVIEFQ